MTRAEDVARRAQEFLRRIASGRNATSANGTSTNATTAASTQAAASLRQAIPAANSTTETKPVAATQPMSPTTAATQLASGQLNSTLNSTLPNAAKQPVELPATTITLPGGIAAPGRATTLPKPLTTNPVEPKPIDASQGPVLLEARNVLEMIDEPATVMPVHSSADRLLGVRDTTQGLLFVQPITSGKRIAIAGAFNNWSTTEHVMKRNEQLGVHELCIRLPKGTFAYRLVIDGQWTHDVHNPSNEPNPFGELNSIATVESASMVGA
jgi:hypothetical protein